MLKRPIAAERTKRDDQLFFSSNQLFLTQQNMTEIYGTLLVKIITSNVSDFSSRLRLRLQKDLD